MATLRATGTVHNVQEKNGISKDRDGNDRAWSLKIVKILTADGVTDVVLGRDFAGQEPRRGDEVDYEVEAYVRGTRLSITALGDYDPLDAVLANA